MTTTFQNTYALVVGIERYQLGKKFDLEGPVNDARSFASWLLKMGVPPANILLFLLPLDENSVNFSEDGLDPQPATKEAIETALMKTLPEQTDGNLLFIFWEGHGFLINGDERCLYYAEADIKGRSSLSLNSLLKSLRSSFFRGFRYQICIIHSCAIHLNETSFKVEPTKFATGTDGNSCEQFILFSSREGKPAWTGSFFNEVMEELEQASADGWPPKMEHLLPRLDKRVGSDKIQMQTATERWYTWIKQTSHTKERSPSKTSRTLSQPCVFVSHCVATEDETEAQLLETVISMLKKEGFEVRSSKDQQELDGNWRRKLDHWIQQCHSAIILFSENALQSERFVYEALLLNWRKSLKPEFALHHILPSSLNNSELNGGNLSRMAINDVHQVCDGNVPEVINEIVQQLISLKKPLAIKPVLSSLQSPIQDLEDVIIPWLQELDRNILLRAALTLGVDATNWPRSKKECGIFLARELLKTELNAIVQALKILAPQLSGDHAHQLLHILGPLWVDAQAIAPVPQIVRRTLPHWSICVNGKRTLTGDMYIRRAYCSFPAGWLTLEVNNVFGESQLEEIEQEIRKEYIRKQCGGDGRYQDIRKDEIEEALSIPRKSGDPSYFAVIRGYVDDLILTKLKQKYPAITFILMSGDTVLDSQELVSSHIESLCPGLEPGEEDDAYELIGQAKRFVENSHPSR